MHTVIDSPMGKTYRFTAEVGGKEIVIETGRLAEQAGGSVTVRCGETVVFAEATMSKGARDGIDFFPLSVDYEEKLYAAGRIPGSYFRREGRPSEQAILISRVIDRPLRPLFPEDMRNEVQILLSSLSHDQENQIDMLGIVAASAALTISDIPWNGPVAGARIGLIDGEFVINPIISQMEGSTLDLRVAGTGEAINMVECAADEVDETAMAAALKLAWESFQPLIALQHEMREVLGKAKNAYISGAIDAALSQAVYDRVYSDVKAAIAGNQDRKARGEAIATIREALVLAYDAHNLTAEKPVKIAQVKDAFETIVMNEVRRQIIEDGIRPDGRSFTQIRTLAAEARVLPRVHGSGLFKRGQTQVMTIATLGTPRDAQIMDGVSPEEDRRYMHHYNFPAFSTGETAPMRGPKRREIGHGALAEAALRAMIPDEDVFPYTIRLVSEVLSSNGSTSMASVCGSTLALMDAGVPIRRPVAGIAMGLVKEGERVAILTDIQGQEDHFGDMDFKVAGTERGITALQMDIKITGVSDQIMEQALEQARVARLQVLDVILSAIPEPRAELSPYAPRMESIRINVEKIGAVIGQGGKTVRSIQDRLKVKVDIQEDGTVFVAGQDGISVGQALEEIRGLTEDAEIGRTYTGKVTRVESYGVFLEFLPGKEGLIHVSQLADHRVENVAAEFHVGDELLAMVTDVDPGGKVRMSRQAVLEGWTAEEARSRDRRPPGGGGDRGGRGGGDRGGRGGGGGDRGGRGGFGGNGGGRYND
jgi:polyribonucleotide nucleotidyltransferase